MLTSYKQFHFEGYFGQNVDLVEEVTEGVPWISIGFSEINLLYFFTLLKRYKEKASFCFRQEASIFTILPSHTLLHLQRAKKNMDVIYFHAIILPYTYMCHRISYIDITLIILYYLYPSHCDETPQDEVDDVIQFLQEKGIFCSFETLHNNSYIECLALLDNYYEYIKEASLNMNEGEALSAASADKGFGGIMRNQNSKACIMKNAMDYMRNLFKIDAVNCLQKEKKPFIDYETETCQLYNDVLITYNYIKKNIKYEDILISIKRRMDQAESAFQKATNSGQDEKLVKLPKTEYVELFMPISDIPLDHFLEYIYHKARNAFQERITATTTSPVTCKKYAQLFKFFSINMKELDHFMFLLVVWALKLPYEYDDDSSFYIDLINLNFPQISLAPCGEDKLKRFEKACHINGIALPSLEEHYAEGMQLLSASDPFSNKFVFPSRRNWISASRRKISTGSTNFLKDLVRKGLCDESNVRIYRNIQHSVLREFVEVIRIFRKHLESDNEPTDPYCISLQIIDHMKRIYIDKEDKINKLIINPLASSSAVKRKPLVRRSVEDVPVHKGNSKQQLYLNPRPPGSPVDVRETGFRDEEKFGMLQPKLGVMEMGLGKTIDSRKVKKNSKIIPKSPRIQDSSAIGRGSKGSVTAIKENPSNRRRTNTSVTATKNSLLSTVGQKILMSKPPGHGTRPSLMRCDNTAAKNEKGSSSKCSSNISMMNKAELRIRPMLQNSSAEKRLTAPLQDNSVTPSYRRSIKEKARPKKTANSKRETGEIICSETDSDAKSERRTKTSKGRISKKIRIGRDQKDNHRLYGEVGTMPLTVESCRSNGPRDQENSGEKFLERNHFQKAPKLSPLQVNSFAVLEGGDGSEAVTMLKGDRHSRRKGASSTKEKTISCNNVHQPKVEGNSFSNHGESFEHYQEN